MSSYLALTLLLAALMSSGPQLARQAPAPRQATVHGSLTIHMLLHAIGDEQYDVTSNPDGTSRLTTTFDYADRGRSYATTATLTMSADERPLGLEVKGTGPATVTVSGDTTTVAIGDTTRASPTPKAWAAVIGPSPFALQVMMMRVWHARGEPKQLALVSPNVDAEPLEIARVGRDLITVAGRRVALDRYTVNHLMLGREIVWMTAGGNLAAAMTFAGGLPMEAVRTEFEPALPDMYRAGVAQEMADLAELGREVPPEHTGTFAIAGATLIDATGAPPIPDAVVIVRDARIVAAGASATTPIPRGVAVIEAKGQTLLPGLWEMHTHASGVEFGPALLAAGETTARDCGGEIDYLIAAPRRGGAAARPGSALVLAGLIDAGGSRAFGHVTAETPDEGRAAVARYHAAGFQQIKLYTYLTPDVVIAIAAEAHRLGMSVTGHVPQALTTIDGVEAGMDQINHLNFVIEHAAPAGRRTGPPDLQSDTAKHAIQFLKDHHTVVDPTASWGEMASHSNEVDVASFEPGILSAPSILDAKFRGMSGTRRAPNRCAHAWRRHWPSSARSIAPA